MKFNFVWRQRRKVSIEIHVRSSVQNNAMDKKSFLMDLQQKHVIGEFVWGKVILHQFAPMAKSKLSIIGRNLPRGQK
jgi:hypothetical protein